MPRVTTSEFAGLVVAVMAIAALTFVEVANAVEELEKECPNQSIADIGALAHPCYCEGSTNPQHQFSCSVVLNSQTVFFTICNDFPNKICHHFPDSCGYKLLCEPSCGSDENGCEQQMQPCNTTYTNCVTRDPD